VKEDLSTFNRSYIMMTLERESRYIKRGFVYSKVKTSLRTSYDDESKDNVEAPKPQEVTDVQNQ